MKDSFTYTKQEALEFKFEQIDLGPQVHPNSVRIILNSEQDRLLVCASLVGGGSILIFQLDDYPVEIRGTLETLVIWHQDVRVFLARITSILVKSDLIVATIRTSRHQRGEEALTVIEIDGCFSSSVLEKVQKENVVKKIARLPILPGL